MECSRTGLDTAGQIGLGMAFDTDFDQMESRYGEQGMGRKRQGKQGIQCTAPTSMRSDIGSKLDTMNAKFDQDQVENGKCPVMPSQNSQPKSAHRLPPCLL